MTNAQALQTIIDNRNDLDMIIDSSNSAAQFVRTSNTFSNDGAVSPLQEALQQIIISIHEGEIVEAHP